MQDQISQYVSKINQVSPKVRQKEYNCGQASGILMEMQVA